MIKVEFWIEHEGCLVNELSRAFPEVKLLCPGGFVVSPSLVEEVIVADGASEDAVERVVEHLRGVDGIRSAEVVERNNGRSFIHITVTKVPEDFCSAVVRRNRCFPIGVEKQEAGQEKWVVGCLHREQADRMLEELGKLGNITHQKITEESWNAILSEVV